jgi:hypothetical protein
MARKTALGRVAGAVSGLAGKMISAAAVAATSVVVERVVEAIKDDKVAKRALVESTLAPAAKKAPKSVALKAKVKAAAKRKKQI